MVAWHVMARWGLHLAFWLAAIGLVALPATAQFRAGTGVDPSQLRVGEPMRPLAWVDIALGTATPRQFLDQVWDVADRQGFAVASRYTHPDLPRMQMTLWRDDVWAMLDNRSKLEVFDVRFYRGGLKAGGEATAAALLRSIAAFVERIPGAGITDRRPDPSLSPTENVGPKPPLRSAELTVSADRRDAVIARLRGFAGNWGFAVNEIFPDPRLRLIRLELWRFDLKIVAENPTRIDTFSIRFYPYYPTAAIDGAFPIVDTYIDDIRAAIADIPTATLSVKP